MANSCAYRPKVRNNQGELVDSRLFDGLLSIFPKDRNNVKKHYFVGTNPTFLERFEDRIELDENGEITLDSYKEITGLDINEEVLLSSLNKKYKTGVLDYNDAIGIANRFNTSDDFKKDYIASLSEAEGGKVKVEIVKRDSTEELKLREFYKKRNLINRILDALRKVGVNVTFLEEGSTNITGRYSTVNVEQTYEGLYSLISVLSGDDLVETLAHEAGHFAYGAIRGSVLAQRLYNSLTEDTINEMFSPDEYTGYSLGSDSLRVELAGRLIGRALINQNTGKLQALLNRIKLQVKKLFATITKDDVKKLRLEAEIAADQIAKNFLSPNFTGSIEVAMSVKEDLYSAKYTKATKVYFDELLTRLRNYQKQMSKISQKNANNYRAQVNSIINKNNPTIEEAIEVGSTRFEQIWSTNGIIDVLGFITAEFQSVVNKLYSFDLSDGILNDERINILREARQYITLASEVLDAIGTALNDKEFLDGLPEDVRNLVNKSYSTLNTLLHQSSFAVGNKSFNTLQKFLEAKEFDAYSMFLEKVYGSKYIKRSKRIVIGKGKERTGKIFGKEFKYYLPRTIRLKGPKGETEWTESITDYLKAEAETRHEEGNWMNWAFTSVQSNLDPSGQITDDAVRFAARYANKNILSYRKRLLDLFEDLNKMQTTTIIGEKVFNRVDASRFYETYDDGTFTGNIIRVQNYGKWTKALSEAYAVWREEFEMMYEASPSLINTPEKYRARFNEFVSSRLDKWHEINSVYDSAAQRYIPAQGGTETKDGVVIHKADYTNPKYRELTVEEKDWIEQWVELKKELDAKLAGTGYKSIHRLPQFRGIATDKLKTALEHSGWDVSKLAKGAGQVIWDEVVQAFSVTSEDPEYGVDVLNDVENELYDPNGGETLGKEIQRMPLFGINKLDNMELLSRDLFYSTLMYASMACKYESMSEVAIATQVGEQVYQNLRDYINEGYTKKYKNKKISAKYSTFDRNTRALEKNIFGKRNKENWGEISANKISTLMSKVGSLVTVAGSVTSGAKDFLGKLLGILREAHVQDYVSTKAVTKACGWYFKHMWEHIMYLGMSYSKDPISQFKSYFNVSDTLDSEINDFEPQKWHIRKFLDSLAYLPLTASGAIETIIYIAVAFDTEIRDVETGKKMSLMDKFEKDRKELKLRQNNEEIYNRDIEVLKDTSKEALDRYKVIKSTSEKMNNFFKNGGTKIFELQRLLTAEELNYINEFLSSGTTDYKKIALLAEEERFSMLYDTKDEAVGVEGLGRFINHRISGVYDIHDRTALQDTWYGAILYTQKGWFTGAIAEAGFIQSHFNTKTKAENEGSHVTAIKYLLDLVNFSEDGPNKMMLLWGLFKATIPGKTGRDGKAILQELGYTPNQAANLVRNIDNVLSVFAMKLMGHLFLLLTNALTKLAGDAPDDEKEEAWLLLAKLSGFIHYIFKASELELASMFLPHYLLKQITTSADVTKFVGPIGIARIGQIAIQGIASWRNNARDKENTEIVYSIDVSKDKIGRKRGLKSDKISPEYAEQLGLNLRGVQTDKEGNIKLIKEYKKYEEDVYKDGRLIHKKGDYKLDHNGKRKVERVRPLYKQQYSQSKKYSSTFSEDPKYKYVEGQNKIRRTLIRTTPYLKHRDVWNDPISAAEDLEKWFWQD